MIPMIPNFEQRERANQIRVAWSNDKTGSTDKALELLFDWVNSDIIDKEEFVYHSTYLQLQEADYIFKKANGIDA